MGVVRACWVVFALTVGAAPAMAQPTEADAERTALARALFDEGVQLLDQRRWDDAADRFRRAYGLRASPVIAFNLASALAQQGRAVEPAELLRRALRDPGLARGVRSAAEDLLAEVTPRIGRLTIRVVGDLAGAELRLDGRVVPVERIGVAAPADPGPHVVSALRGGNEVARVEATLEPAGASEIRIVVPPPAARPAPRATPAVVADQPDEPAPATSGSGARPVRREAHGDSDVDDESDDGESYSLLGSPWFWIGVAVVAVVAAVAGVMSSEGSEPRAGDLGIVEIVGR